MNSINENSNDADDELVYTVSNRNVFMRKVSRHLPSGSFKLLYAAADDSVCIEILETRAIILLELCLTWKQTKRSF